MLLSSAPLPSGHRARPRRAALCLALLLTPLTLALPTPAPAQAPAQSQDTFTPMPLDSGFAPIDTTAPPIPAAQIIQQFAARETEFREALKHYTYVRTVTIQTINDYTRSPDGEWSQVDDIVINPDGSLTQQTVYAPPSTLRRIALSPSDLDDIEHSLPFALTTDELAAYNIVYVGKQKVDEIGCYVFNVSPRQVLKNHRYLYGRIWVEDRDFQIVITNGRMVPDDTKPGHQDLHPPFMTWRQQIDGHYWFPTYVKGEGILHFAPAKKRLGADIHIREIIKYQGYKRATP